MVFRRIITFGQTLAKLRTKITQERVEEKVIAVTSLSEQEIREKLREELYSHYQGEKLVREYSNATLYKILQVSNPQDIQLGQNEQLAARVHLVSPGGIKYEVDIYFKVGESYSLDRFYEQVTAQIEDKNITGPKRSKMVRESTYEANWYIQRWQSRTPQTP